MLILSQDKTKTTENIELDIKWNLISNEVESYTIFSIKDCRNFGIYDTEERAKEVLQEIIKVYKTQTQVMYNAENYTTKYLNMKLVYEMPEK